MRHICVGVLLLASTACGSDSATEVRPTRYNFAVVDGLNQKSAAGDATLANRITSQLTRDPKGEFATRVFDFLAPTAAYAQGLSLAGTPVADAIVCGREANPGEPQIVPLCAFTLADGKAANNVVPGTKAGTYNIVFTAQVPSQEPVKDSTTVIVGPGDPAEVSLIQRDGAIAAGDSIDLHTVIFYVRDKYENMIVAGTIAAGIPQNTTAFTPQYAVRDGSELGDPSPDSTGWWVKPTVNPTGKSNYNGNPPLTHLFVYVWVGPNTINRPSFSIDLR